MTKFDYTEKGISQKAFDSIRKYDSFTLSVSGWKVKSIKKNLPIFQRSFTRDKSKKRSLKRYLVRFLIFAPLLLFAPTFWFIALIALDHEMEMVYEENSEGALIFKFTSNPTSHPRN